MCITFALFCTLTKISIFSKIWIVEKSFGILKNVEFCPKFQFQNKISFFDQILDLIFKLWNFEKWFLRKNFDFSQKNKFLTWFLSFDLIFNFLIWILTWILSFDQNRKFWPRTWFDQNCDFWPKSWFLTKIVFLTKILFFEQNRDFWPKSWFFTKIVSLDQNRKFWPKSRFLTKISISSQNFDFQNFYFS